MLHESFCFSRHLQLSKRLYREVNEAVDKLQNFFEKRQQRIKEITRLQALKDELNQVKKSIHVQKNV